MVLVGEPCSEARAASERVNAKSSERFRLWRKRSSHALVRRKIAMPTEFRGSYTVTITPFTDGGKKIDLPAWKRFVDWQIKVGAPGIIILGTTGEFLTL